MKIYKFAIASLISAFSLWSPSAAALSAEDYLKSRNTEPLIAYLYGAFDAYNWANSRLDTSGREMLYCLPPTMRLGSANFFSLIDEQMKRLKERKDSKAQPPVDLLLLLGLEENFPCTIRK